ncbi:hypothetical protein [Nocardia sp. BMG51109]|uniref:hypothetical protein n=1 Tax=Nocardia sp. BMG51109 TaxID=1056816 RepID=UPI0004665FC5|nr:hypothetical protein [Nocardia sp. BMG51109]
MTGTGPHTNPETATPSNPVQLVSIIEFGLSRLAGNNGHHEFEHLCRWIAKRRLVSNVLPATGPVSSGGDQGRDFETFHTYLARELPFSIGFLAHATTDAVAFACTIQKDNLRRKFERDIDAICTQGTPVDRIYILTTANVPVRLRHELQDWAQAQHSVALDVLDGKMLAEFLAEPELYWLAEQYLDLPPELTPPRAPTDRTSELPAGYIELREYWQEPDRQPVNLGDLFDLADGLRYAIRPGPARSDLPGWLRLTTRLAEQSPDREVRLYATYELVAARSRGAADLRPAEALIRTFIDEIVHSNNPTLLFDASVLIQFCSAAATMGQTDIPLSETAGWVPRLRRHVDDLLNQEWGPNARAGLLEAAAHLSLHLDYTGVEPHGTATLDELDQHYEALIDSIESGTLRSHLDTTEPTPIVDLDAAMGHLLTLVELLPDAPAYPIGTLAMTIDVLTPQMQDHRLYQRVCDRLDEAVARRDGDAAVAERCRQRAQSFESAGRPLDALREYHKAKVKWFHGDTFQDALDTIVHIIDLYSELGMYLVAKKYALGLAALAYDGAAPSDSDLTPLGMFAAAKMDHLAGAWIASAKLATMAGRAHMALAPDSGNLERHTIVTEAIKFQGFTTVIAEQTRPAFLPLVHSILRGSIFDEFTHPRAISTSANAQTEVEWTDWLSETAGAPFSDVGPQRDIVFHALGVKWALHARNDHDTVLVLEDFAATLQIVLVELAALDPVLLAQDIDIEIRSYQRDQPPAQTYLTRRYNGQRQWLLQLPTTTGPDDATESAVPKANLSHAFQVIAELSLFDQNGFSQLIDQAAENGLLSNLEIGRPYRHMATLFGLEPVTPQLTSPVHRSLTNPERPNPRASAPQMQPRTGPGPGYSLEKARTILTERYEILPISIRHTIPHLLSGPEVRELFQQLRDEGWKDWHLLNVVVNMTVNHRLTLRHGPLTMDDAPRLTHAFHAEAMREEHANDPRISPDAITPETMDMGIRLVAVSSLHRWGLTMHHNTDETGSIMDILASRYGFWNDDVPHRDPFGGQLHPSRNSA